jgi:hypothetical protein
MSERATSTPFDEFCRDNNLTATQVAMFAEFAYNLFGYETDTLVREDRDELDHILLDATDSNCFELDPA